MAHPSLPTPPSAPTAPPLAPSGALGRAPREDMERLQHLSADLTRVLTRDVVSEVVVRHLIAGLGARAGGVVELSEDGREFILLGSVGFGEDVRRRYARYPVDTPIPVRDVARTGAGVFLGSDAEWEARYGGLPTVGDAERGGAWAALPLHVDDRLLGALTVNLPGPHTFPEGERRFLQAFADLCAQALERARLYEAEHMARGRAEALQRVTATLARVRTVADVARVFSRELTTLLDADTAWVGMTTPDGTAVEALGWSGYPDGASDHWRHLSLDAGTALTDAVRSGRAQWWPTRDAIIAAYPERAPVIRAAAQEGVAVLPLPDDDGHAAVGGIVVGFREPRRFDEDTRVFFLALAQQCAQALARARLLEATRAAQDTAERAADRARRLQQLTARLNEATSREQIADAIFAGALAAVGADAGSLALLHRDAEGRPAEFETVRSAGFDPAAAGRYQRFPLVAGLPLSDAVLARAPIFLGSLDAWRERYPGVANELAPLGFHAFAAVPVIAADRVAAALAFSFRDGRDFDEATRTFLVTLGEQCALALERQRLHEAALERAAQQAVLFETIQDAFVALDRGLRFTYLNSRAESMLRVTAAEVLGRSIGDVFPQGDGTPIRRMIQRTLATGEAVAVEELSAVTHSWVDMRVFPAPDGVSILMQDVTARRRAQEASSFLAEASRILTASLDHEATLRALAEAAVPRLGDWCAVDLLVEPRSAEAPGAWPPAVERLAVAHRDPARAAQARDLARQRPPDWSSTRGLARVLRDGVTEFHPALDGASRTDGARSPDDEPLLLHDVVGAAFLCVPLVSRGRTLGALTLCTSDARRRYDDADRALAEDLAQRAAAAVEHARLYREAERARAQAEQARAEAEAANRSKSQFLATMSHELRTPLNAIGGYAELLELGVHGPVTPDQRSALTRIQRSQRHLLGLINEVLNYARVEGGTVHYDLRQVGVAGALGIVESFVLPQARAKALSLAIDGCDAALAVWADDEKLRQVLLNLLSNAIKFTGDGGRITVTCRARSAGAVEIAVADTGSGIAADQLEKVFEPFVQVGRALNSPQEGTGLGLAISRDLARGMGGDLSVESTIGVGSTFTLVLPQA